MKQKGFTIVEFIVVIGVIALLFGAIFTTQTGLITGTYLDTKTKEIVESLRLAQMRSITQYKDDNWGVYFNNGFVLFKGSSYAGRDVSYDIQTDLSPQLLFLNINLNGGGDYIVFDKVTGKTGNYGSIQISDDKGNSNIFLINMQGVVDVN